ncbi:MAG: copper amine oxidase N-terminal domain-containing protein [Bacillota bacterium]
MQKPLWIKKPLALIMAISLAYAGGLALANQPEPGSKEDPLVTRGYVRLYLAQELAGVSTAIEQLSAQVAELEKRLAKVKASRPQPVFLTIGQPTAYVGQTAYTLDVAPFLTQGRTMVPFRFLGEALGAQVGWNQASQEVTYRLREREVALVIGQTTAKLSGNPVKLEVAPQLVNGRTMIPLRAVGELLGARFDWQPATQTVIVYP